MSLVKLHDLYFKPFLSEKEIKGIVQFMVQQVYEDLEKSEVPLFIGVLNGSFLFTADFIREFKGNCEFSFVKMSSYKGANSTSVVNQLIRINEDLTDRTINHFRRDYRYWNYDSEDLRNIKR